MQPGMRVLCWVFSFCDGMHEALSSRSLPCSMLMRCKGGRVSRKTLTVAAPRIGTNQLYELKQTEKKKNCPLILTSICLPSSCTITTGQRRQNRRLVSIKIAFVSVLVPFFFALFQSANGTLICLSYSALILRESG